MITYYVVICHRGKHKWVRVGTLRDAKLLKKEIEAPDNTRRIEKLGLTGRHKRIDDFFQEYADHVKLRTFGNTVKRYLGVLNTFLAFLKTFHPNLGYLTQIKPEHIESYQKQRLESTELKADADGDKPDNHKNKRLPLPQTVNFEVGIIRSVFMWAHDRELIPAVPTKKVKPLRPKPKKQAKVLTPDQCRQFLKTAREAAKSDKPMRVYYKAFKFLLNTGLRSGELCNLTWDDVDLETGLMEIQPKEGWTPKRNSRQFYLNESSLEVLRSFGERERYIFTDLSGRQLDPSALRKALIEVAQAPGLNDLTRVHDLRHTFSSHMQMNGVDPGTMAAILGHRSYDVTMIYTHQTQEHLRKSINKIGIG